MKTTASTLGTRLKIPKGYTTCKACNRLLLVGDADANGLCVDCRPDVAMGVDSTVGPLPEVV